MISGGQVLNPDNGGPFALLAAPGGATSRASTDFLSVVATAGGAATVQRPSPRVAGSVFGVLDGDGSAVANPITVDGDGDLIDGGTSVLVNLAFAAAVFVYDGTQWRRLTPRRQIAGSALSQEYAVDDTAEIIGGGVPTTRTLTAGLGLTGGGDLSANRTFNVGANPDGSIAVAADTVGVGVLASDAQHGARGGGTQHAVATPAVAGFMSAADKVKVDMLTIETVVFRPGVASSGNHVATWAEVDALLTATLGKVVLFVDDTLAACVVPGTALTQGFGRVQVRPFGTSATLTIADGGQLKNFAVFNEMILVAEPTVRSPLLFDLPNQVVEIIETTVASGGALTTQALIQSSAATVVFVVTGTSFIDNTASPAVPCIAIDSGKFLGLNVLGVSFWTMPATLVQGDALTSFTMNHDLSIEFVAQALMLGAVTEQRTSFLAAAQPSFGALLARPVTTYVGQIYFDTTLGFLIAWNGAAWVNGAGAVV